MRLRNWSANRLIGEPVRNSAGETLGQIQELIVDPATARIDFAVIRLVPVVGVEDRYVAVPLNALGVSSGRDYVLLDVDKNFLDRGPSSFSREWPDFTDPPWRARVYNYYGVAEPAAIPSRVVVEHRDYLPPGKECLFWV